MFQQKRNVGVLLAITLASALSLAWPGIAAARGGGAGGGHAEGGSGGGHSGGDHFGASHGGGGRVGGTHFGDVRGTHEMRAFPGLGYRHSTFNPAHHVAHFRHRHRRHVAFFGGPALDYTYDQCWRWLPTRHGWRWIWTCGPYF
ncbi:MAG TPA: hypothetical protein VE224_01600 [Pseudolabrys sp.]|nr:hypothetical protein [Pseudolabrys sp.]